MMKRTAMEKKKNVEGERNGVGMSDTNQDKRKVDFNEITIKKRKLHCSREAATIHACPVDNKVLLKKSKGLVSDSIALRVKRQKPFPQSNLQNHRYDDDDNIFFLTEMLKLVGSGLDEHPAVRNINVGELHRHVSKRFGHNYTRRQAYEKARRLRNIYVSKFLKRSAPFEDAKKEQIFKLCRQLWGDCGLLKLHLEDEDGPVSSNDQLGFSTRDGDSSHEDAYHGLEGVGPSEDVEGEKGVRAEGVPCVEEKQVGLCQHITENIGEEVREPGNSSTEWNAQRLYEVLHDKHEELLHGLEKKCEFVLDEIQDKLMTMITNALGSRNEAPVGRILDILKPPGLTSHDVFVERMLAASMQECSNSVAKHLQDRLQKLRVGELKLVSDRLQLMLEICQIEQEKLERQAGPF